MHDAQEIIISEEALRERREYYRRWREANPEKVKEYQRRYWVKKAEKARKDSEGER